jgi:hypothetical protein
MVLLDQMLLKTILHIIILTQQAMVLLVALAQELLLDIQVYIIFNSQPNFKKQMAGMTIIIYGYLLTALVLPGLIEEIQ